MKRHITLACMVSIMASATWASSHREAPLITEMPKVDATDFYMFNSYEPGREGFVTLIANYLPLQDAYGGPNYFTMDPDALYEIHVSNDDDPEEEISFQFRFKNSQKNIALDIDGKDVAIPLRYAGPIGPGKNDVASLNEHEMYQVSVVYGDRRDGDKYIVTNANNNEKWIRKPIGNVGNKTLPNYASYADEHITEVNIPNCGVGRIFVGQRREGFAVNLGKIFDLVNTVPIEANAFPGGINQSPLNNVVRDKNITSIALEVPASCLVSATGNSIGAWTTASLKKARILNSRGVSTRHSRKLNAERHTGGWVQVSRLGMPLVNEVVIGLRDKDLFNRSEPKNDAQFANYVTNPTLPALLNILFKDAVNTTLGTEIPDLAPINFPRNDLVTTFLTGFAGVNQISGVGEMLRLNTAIPATEIGSQHNFGVAGGDLAGFPNGRRPGDDVVDVALRVVMGALCHDLPLGANGEGVNLLLCGENAEEAKNKAVVGNVPFTDGAPVSDVDFMNRFPYLTTPVAGSFVSTPTVTLTDNNL